LERSWVRGPSQQNKLVLWWCLAGVAVTAVAAMCPAAASSTPYQLHKLSGEVKQREARVAAVLPGWSKTPSPRSEAACLVADAPRELAEAGAHYQLGTSGYFPLRVTIVVMALPTSAIARDLIVQSVSARTFECLRTTAQQEGYAATTTNQRPPWVPPARPTYFLHSGTMTLRSHDHGSVVLTYIYVRDRSDPRLAYSITIDAAPTSIPRKLIAKLLAAAER
jgi:hypothetical protein